VKPFFTNDQQGETKNGKREIPRPASVYPSGKEETLAELYLVEFKGSRREVFANPNCLGIRSSDYVVVQAERGEDLGKASKKVEGKPKEPGRKPHDILRKATDEDLKKLIANREKETECFKECQRMIAERKLEMKLVDVELQFDNHKLTFFFTAEKRVDFRELVKELAAAYKTRIELRQIGVRDEAKRIGGFGVCGLPLCCSSFLRDFEPISTQLAREQNLSLNPAKISGNCGRLLCCLLYERELYQKSLPQYPKIGSKFKTEKGEGIVDKIRILKEQIVVKHETGEEEKISLAEIKKSEKKQAGILRRWLKKES
jgi:cell fate regulator YaaT (PSP1 superfamily)